MKRSITATAAVAIGLLGTFQSTAMGCDINVLQSFYLQYLGRPVEACAIPYWSAQFHAGASPAVIQAGILASDEYYAAHGCTPQGFVCGLYADVLGRAAQPCEIQNWVCRVPVCGCRNRVTLEFLQAASIELSLRHQPLLTPAFAPPPPVAYAAPVPVPGVRFVGYAASKPHHGHGKFRVRGR